MRFGRVELLNRRGNGTLNHHTIIFVRWFLAVSGSLLQWTPPEMTWLQLGKWLFKQIQMGTLSFKTTEFLIPLKWFTFSRYSLDVLAPDFGTHPNCGLDAAICEIILGWSPMASCSPTLWWPSSWIKRSAPWEWVVFFQVSFWKGKTSFGVPGGSWNFDEMFDSYVLTVVTQ